MAGHDQKARLVQAILDNRRQRLSYLPAELFSENAWSALLHLFIGDAASRRLTGHDLVQLVRCSPSVMRRWLIYLSEQKLVIGDGDGDLSDLLTLAPKAIDAIEHYLDDTLAMADSFFRADGLES